MALLLGSRRHLLLLGPDLIMFANLQLANGLQDSGILCKCIDVALLARCHLIMHPNYLVHHRKAVSISERAILLQLHAVGSAVESWVDRVEDQNT